MQRTYSLKHFLPPSLFSKWQWLRIANFPFSESLKRKSQSKQSVRKNTRRCAQSGFGEEQCIWRLYYRNHWPNSFILTVYYSFLRHFYFPSWLHHSVYYTFSFSPSPKAHRKEHSSQQTKQQACTRLWQCASSSIKSTYTYIPLITAFQKHLLWNTEHNCW